MINVYHINQPNKSKLVLYIAVTFVLKQVYTSNKAEHFSYRDECGIHGHMHIEALIKEELTWATVEWLKIISNLILFKTRHKTI